MEIVDEPTREGSPELLQTNLIFGKNFQFYMQSLIGILSPLESVLNRSHDTMSFFLHTLQDYI